MPLPTDDATVVRAGEMLTERAEAEARITAACGIPAPAFGQAFWNDMRRPRNGLTVAAQQLLLGDVGFHHAKGYVESAARAGRRLPNTFKVPVQTRQRQVERMATLGGSVEDVLVTNPTCQAVTFNTVRVVVTDQRAHDMPVSGMPVSGARVAADTAAQSGVLLSPVPIAIHRDPVLAYTTYDFYVTSAAEINDIAIEHAHAVYAHDTGDVLGDYTVVQGTSANSVQLRYQWNGTQTALTELTDAMLQFGTATTAATNNIFNVGPWSSNRDLEYIGLHDNEESRTARAARAAQLVVVRDRANRLFMSHLTERQRLTWTDEKHADLQSPSGRRYRVKNYRSGNVFLLDATGREVRKYCAYANDPGGSLPDGDYWYTQMLALQFDERMFLRAANTWDLLQPGHPFVGQGVDADAPEAAVVMAA